MEIEVHEIRVLPIDHQNRYVLLVPDTAEDKEILQMLGAPGDELSAHVFQDATGKAFVVLRAKTNIAIQEEKFK